MKMLKAQAALLAVTFLGLVATVSLVGSRVIVNEIRHSGRIENTMTAFFAAEAGIEDGLVRLKFDPTLISSHGSDNKFKTLINLDGGGESLASGAENNSDNFSNRLYRLKIWSETGTQIEREDVKKDEILEFQLPESALGKTLTINWGYPLSGPTPPSGLTPKAHIEARVYDAASGLAGQFVIQKINPNPNDISLQIPLPAAWSTPSHTKDLRLRLRPYFVYVDSNNNTSSTPIEKDTHYSINLSISASPITLSTGRGFIESTGFYRNTQRTLKATIGTTSGQVVSLLDFAVFAGEGNVQK